MVTPTGPKVLEYNCRFGDPEAQATLPGLRTDLVDVFEACLQNRLAELAIDHDGRPCVCLVAADQAYPDGFAAGSPVEGIEAASAVPGAEVYHALTEAGPYGPVSRGGRVLNVIGRGAELAEARRVAYRAMESIRLDGAPPRYRRDIGHWGTVSDPVGV